MLRILGWFFLLALGAGASHSPTQPVVAAAVVLCIAAMDWQGVRRVGWAVADAVEWWNNAWSGRS